MQKTNRRDFMAMTAGAGFLLGNGLVTLRADEPKRKAPFIVLFSNDTTNIESCPGPIKKRGTPFTDANLQASVAETAGKGIDVHLLQPGLGWVPWWQSEVLPMKQHVAWLAPFLATTVAFLAFYYGPRLASDRRLRLQQHLRRRSGLRLAAGRYVRALGRRQGHGLRQYRRQE